MDTHRNPAGGDGGASEGNHAAELIASEHTSATAPAQAHAYAFIVADDIPVVGGELDVDTLLQQVRTFSSGLAMVERAIAMPKQSVSSTFKFGVAYGALRTVVALCSIPYRYPLKSKPCRGGYLDGALSSRSATRPSELVP